MRYSSLCEKLSSLRRMAIFILHALCQPGGGFRGGFRGGFAIEICPGDGELHIHDIFPTVPPCLPYLCPGGGEAGIQLIGA